MRALKVGGFRDGERLLRVASAALLRAWRHAHPPPKQPPLPPTEDAPIFHACATPSSTTSWPSCVTNAWLHATSGASLTAPEPAAMARALGAGGSSTISGSCGGSGGAGAAATAAASPPPSPAPCASSSSCKRTGAQGAWKTGERDGSWQAASEWLSGARAHNERRRFSLALRALLRASRPSRRPCIVRIHVYRQALTAWPHTHVHCCLCLCSSAHPSGSAIAVLRAHAHLHVHLQRRRGRLLQHGAQRRVEQLCGGTGGGSGGGVRAGEGRWRRRECQRCLPPGGRA